MEANFVLSCYCGFISRSSSSVSGQKFPPFLDCRAGSVRLADRILEEWAAPLREVFNIEWTADRGASRPQIKLHTMVERLIKYLSSIPQTKAIQ